MCTCNMKTVQQNGRFTLFSSKFPSNIYSILCGIYTRVVKEIFESGILWIKLNSVYSVNLKGKLSYSTAILYIYFVGGVGGSHQTINSEQQTNIFYVLYSSV